MSVVSDTTAITTLLKAKQQRLLQELYDCVLVPQAVWDELKEFHPDLPEFIELRPVTGAAERLPGTELLGRGEAEALLLAKQLSARLLLFSQLKPKQVRRLLFSTITSRHTEPRNTVFHTSTGLVATCCHENDITKSKRTRARRTRLARHVSHFQLRGLL